MFLLYFLLQFVYVACQMDTAMLPPQILTCQNIIDEMEDCWTVPEKDKCVEIIKETYSGNVCTRNILQKAKDACDKEKESYQNMFESMKSMILYNKLVCSYGFALGVDLCWKKEWFPKLASVATNKDKCSDVLNGFVENSKGNCSDIISTFTSKLGSEMNCAQNSQISKENCSTISFTSQFITLSAVVLIKLFW